MLKTISKKIIQETFQKALESPRKRMNYNLHDESEKVQRILNCIYKDSYIIPHKHENPDKVELFIALQGKAVVVAFDQNGGVKETSIISADGPNFAVEIPPQTWHSLILLSEKAAFMEIIEGPYYAKTHKEFASWAPENTKEGLDFNKSILQNLQLQ